MTAAHASVGNAATSPTTGAIFSPADATRHGAASKPQPPSENTSGITINRVLIGRIQA